MTRTLTDAVAARIDGLDWNDLEQQLDDRGFAVTERLLDESECHALAGLFELDRFRSTIDMARHRFGDGRYRYFAHPLPEAIESARVTFYEHLAPIANRWADLLSGDNPVFPATHGELLERCRAAGQLRPTPLLLRYGVGDWNALHQDLYGEVSFPFQVLTVLSDPETDYDGWRVRPDGAAPTGTEPSPRPATPAAERSSSSPRANARTGARRATTGSVCRHGVSTVTAGTRTALGIIFHDAL